MAFTHKITRTWQGTSGPAVTDQVTKTADSELNISLNVAASESDYVIAGAVDEPESRLLSFFASSDADIVVKTNEIGGGAGATITIKAGHPIVWAEGDTAGSANPLGTVDVTSFHAITGAIGTDGANLEMRMIIDSTPA
jgi:hypothetical protein